MPGRKVLRRIQFGAEVTPGTGVAATARWRGNGDMPSDDREVVFPPELVGIMGGTDRSYIAKIAASLSLAETPATPEQLPYLFAMLYGGPKTGTADGVGSSGFKYTTTIPTTSGATNTAYTIEGGDDYEVERITYAKATKLTLKGTQAGPVTMSADLIGQQVTRLPGGFAAANLVDVNDLIFGGARLYLDAVSGTMGTTLITSQFLGFELIFEAMWVPKYTGEGATAPTWGFVVYADQKITGKLTLEHDAAANGDTGLKSLWRAQTPRLMRIEVLGQAYATPGTGTTLAGRRGLQVNLPIKITKIPPLDDLDGNDTVTIEFESRYNATFGSSGSILICNETSALP